MTRHDRYLLRLWLARWGFALMVAVAITVGLVAALTVSLPIEIPTIALRAAAVYRVEVGAAVFGGLYVASMAFALSLHKRGFTEIGSGGFKAQDLAAASEGDLAGGVAMELLTELRDEIDDIQLQRQGNENSSDRGMKMRTERLPDSAEVVQARHERMDRLLDELREAVERRRAIFAKWRAEGLLPPEEPRRRF